MERSEHAKLQNLKVICGWIEEVEFPFQVGVALHACGAATDVSLEKCEDAGASFIMCSCCVGKIPSGGVTTPRSKAFAALNSKEYEVLARAADHNSSVTRKHSNQSLISRQEVLDRRRCKTLVEVDRVRRAEALGYAVRLLIMQPVWASPKNDIIVGVHQRYDHATEVLSRLDEQLEHHAVDWWPDVPAAT